MANFTQFPAQLQAELQTGFLEREFEEGLDSVLAYRRECLMETVPARIGETLTRTRTGRKAPVTKPTNPQTNTGLDNGMTPSDASLEQYLMSLFQYNDSTDVDILGDMAAIANNLTRVARNNGVQAAQTQERLARQALFAAYLGGNSRVRTDLGAGGTTSCHVDDVRGFFQVLVNGVPTSVSGTNTLTVSETAVSNSGVTQTLTVTGVAADAVNLSSVPDGVSGVITFSAATTPVNGDALIAANAPKILRPFGHITTAQMVNSDVLTMGIILDAVSYLRDNAVPPMGDGRYHVILDNTSMRQIFADQDFKVMLAASRNASEFRDGDIVQLFDTTFIPTTETYVQQAGSSGATGASANTVRIRRVIVCGAEHMIEGTFEGMDSWLERQGVNAFGEIFLINNVAHIIRPPLDRLQQFVSLSWTWIGCYTVPTDLTANSTIIPTASNSLYKRSVVIETAG